METPETRDHESLYQTLAGEILRFERKPGEPLSEHELCRRFGLSRTPVRSLLQRLQENGLVQIVPRSGSRVTRLDMKLINQLIYERVAVETMVLRDFVALCNPTDIERIRYLYVQMQQAAEGFGSDRFQPDEFIRRDLAMHGEWFRRLNLETLWARLSMPESSYTRFCMLDILQGNNVPDVLEEHGEMLRLIEEKDAASIEPLLKKHLYGGVRRLGSRIYTTWAEYFEPFEGEIHEQKLP